MITFIVLSVVFSCGGFLAGIIYTRYWSKKFIQNHHNKIQENIKIVNANFQKALKDFEVDRKKIDDKLIEEYRQTMLQVTLEAARDLQTQIDNKQGSFLEPKQNKPMSLTDNLLLSPKKIKKSDLH